MSEANGDDLIVIGRKGTRTVCFGDPKDPNCRKKKLDIIDVSNQLTAIDNVYRDEVTRKVPREKIIEYNNACWDFARALFEDQTLTMAEALEFVKTVVETSQELRRFFVIKSAQDEPSSPENSTTLVLSE